MENIDIKVTELTEQMKQVDRRLETLEETTRRIESLTLSVEKLAISVESMTKAQAEYRTKQNELAGKIIEIENRPFKKKSEETDKVIWSIASAAIGVIVGFAVKALLGI